MAQLTMSLCPNCGSQAEVNPTCIHCWWSEGENFFRPVWMDEKTWQKGMMSQWRIPAKKK